MEERLIRVCAVWMLCMSVATNLYGQRLPERDPRARSDEADTLIADAIKQQQADPQVTRVAESTLRSLIWWERRMGLKFGPDQLEKFLSGRGGDVKYVSSSQIAQWTRQHEGAQYSHQQAHENATKRIVKWIEEQVQGGRTSFPARITLESIGFVHDYIDENSPGYKDRLQGPTLYQNGLVFSVPVPYLEAPKSVVELIISFGDLQGPHEGVITGLKVDVVEKDGKRTVNYKYKITYTWNDKFTFDNDTKMSEYDRAAHYLEFIAKTAKAYKTTVLMDEQVSGSVELPVSNPDSNGNSGSDANNPGNQNPGDPETNNPGTNNPGQGDPHAGDPSGPSADGGDHGAGSGSPSGGSGSTGKLPPIKIPHPPGWGVK